MGKVTPEMCAELRRKAKQKPVKDIDVPNVDVSLNTIQRHVYGRCTHEIDEKAKECSGQVTEKDCKKIRQLYVDKETSQEVADEFNIHVQTIRYHLKAECGHNVSEDIIKWVGNTEIKHFHVTEEECKKIRQLFDEYHDIDAISDRINRNEATIYNHLHERCSHDIEYTSTAQSNKVSREECKNIREIYRNSDNIEEIKDKTKRARRTINSHAKAECKHEVSEDVSKCDIGKPNFNHTDEKECKKIRRLYKNGLTWKHISDITGRTKSSIAYHLKAKCNHEVSKDIIKRQDGNNESEKNPVEQHDIVTVDECSALKYLYHEEHMPTDEIKKLDNVDISKHTIEKHVSDSCRHNLE